MKTKKMDSTYAAAITHAEELAKSAKTVDELQRALTVLLTLQHELTLKEVAKVIGRSPSWVQYVRKAFIERGVTTTRHDHGGRRNQILQESEEEPFMEEACRRYMDLWRKRDWPIFEPPPESQFYRLVHKMLEERSGRQIPYSTVFSLMARIGRKKFGLYEIDYWRRYANNNF